MAVMPIERGKTREYAIATGAARTEYLDDAHAPVPPTFLSTVVFWENLSRVFELPETLRECSALGIVPDTSGLLSLAQEYEFHGELLRAGEVVATELRLDGVRRVAGRSGLRVEVTFTVSFTDEAGRLRAECHYTSAVLQKSHASS